MRGKSVPKMKTLARHAIERKLTRVQKGEPFSREQLKGPWSSRTLGRVLAELVTKGKVVRVLRGIYARPKKSQFTGKSVVPGPYEILQFIVASTGEVLQVHGAEAIRRLRLSTQMQITPVYYTSGRTRSIVVRNASIRLEHKGSRVLQHAGTRLGTLISAFHYIDASQITGLELGRILSDLKPVELAELMSSKIPPDHMKEINRWYLQKAQKTRACAEIMGHGNEGIEKARSRTSHKAKKQ